MLKIRLTRMGDKKTPFYRLVVAESRTARDGKFVEQIGTFDPLKTPEVINVNNERVAYWIKNGAQPTETAKALLVKCGAINK